MMAEFTLRLEKIIKKYLPYKKRFVNLSLQTRIYEDLKLDGSDAWELLEEISSEFNLDIYTFEFNEHFNSDGAELPTWRDIKRILNNTTAQKKRPLTIGQIKYAIEIGSWSIL